MRMESPPWGPWLWQLAKGPCGSARLSQQPLSDAQPSPSLRKSYRRQYTHPDAHTYTLTDGEYQVGPWKPPDHPLGQTSASGEVKTPSRIKGEKQRGGGEGRNREMGVKRSRISISSCSLGCLPNHQFPLRMSLGRLERDSSQPGRDRRWSANHLSGSQKRSGLCFRCCFYSLCWLGPRFSEIFLLHSTMIFAPLTFLLQNVGYYCNILTGLDSINLPDNTLEVVDIV